MTETEINKDEFYAHKKAEGFKIDPNTAHISWHYAQVLDPYGIDDVPKKYSCVGRTFFARAPGSDTWVEFGDLPAETCNSLQNRLSAKQQAQTLPFNARLERMADAIGAIYDPYPEDDLNYRARALEAAQAALNALQQFDAIAGESTANT